jgi:endonuclease/exonuclease/phosphatase family metal-dependent hydrolase
MPTHRPLFLCALFASGATALGQNAPASIVIDGAFEDWSTPDASMIDPAGDAQANLDVTRLEAFARGDVLCLSLHLTEPLNLQSGVEEDGSLILRITDQHGNGLVIDQRARTVSELVGDTLRTTTWKGVGYVSAPTYAATRFEMRLPLGEGALAGVEAGDTLTIDITGSDELDEPLQVTVAEGETATIKPRDPARSGDVSLRVLSLNTLRTGTQDEQRGPALARIIDGLDPDIVCLQEEWDSSESDIAQWLTDADPRETGGAWSVYKLEGNAIAAKPGSRIEPLDADPEGRFALAGVTVDGRRLVIASIHFKCCGHIGSSEDARRIAQARLLREALDALPETRPELAQAPRILAGDYNLVGSRTPLDIILAGEDAALVDVAPMRLHGLDNTTWRDLRPRAGGFPPGRLDLLVAPAGLASNAEGFGAQAFAFDASDADPEDLRSLGIRPVDSIASDHLPLVLDLSSVDRPRTIESPASRR